MNYELHYCELESGLTTMKLDTPYHSISRYDYKTKENNVDVKT